MFSRKRFCSSASAADELWLLGSCELSVPESSVVSAAKTFKPQTEAQQSETAAAANFFKNLYNINHLFLKVGLLSFAVPTAKTTSELLPTRSLKILFIFYKLIFL